MSHGDLIPVIPQVLGCWDAGTGALVSGGDTGAGAEPLLGTRVRELGSSAPAGSSYSRYPGMDGTMSLRNEARRGQHSGFQGRNAELAIKL